MNTQFLTILPILLAANSLIAQTQTFTTYGPRGMESTTINPTPTGYNYSVIGHNGASVGVATVQPGAQVGAVIAPGIGIAPVLPIGYPRSQDSGIVEMATVSAPIYALPPLPRRSAPQHAKEPTKEFAKEIPPPAGYKTYGQYAWLHNQLSPACMKQFAADWARDSGSKPNTLHDTHVLLGYLRLWVRSHPGCLTGKVIQKTAK